MVKMSGNLQMHQKKIVFLTLPFLFLGINQTLANKNSNSEILASDQNVVAFVEGKFTCKEKIKINISAQNRDVFENKTNSLKAVLNALRTRLSFDCEIAKSILVEGLVNKEKIYRGAFSEGTNWRLIDLHIKPKKSLKAAVEKKVKPKTINDDDLNLPPGVQPEQKNKISKEAIILPPVENQNAIDKQETKKQLAAVKNLDSFVNLNKHRVKQDFNLDGYKFSGLMTEIFYGNFKAIPDDQKTRSQVISILRAFSENCGSMPNDIAFAASNYGVPQFREMRRKPMQGFTNLLQDIVRMRDRGFATGDYMGEFQKLNNKHAAYRIEGLEDGKLFISRYGCVGKAPNKFKNNLFKLIRLRTNDSPASHDDIKFNRLMSSEFRKQNNIPDPKVALLKREQSLRVAKTKNSCMTKFKDDQFCQCATDKLVQASFNKEQWHKLSTNFLNIVKFAEMRPRIKTCY